MPAKETSPGVANRGAPEGVHASAYMITYADAHIPNVIHDPDSANSIYSEYSPQRFKEIRNIKSVGITKPKPDDSCEGMEAIREWAKGHPGYAWIWYNGEDHYTSYVQYGKRDQQPVSYSYL